MPFLTALEKAWRKLSGRNPMIVGLSKMTSTGGGGGGMVSNSSIPTAPKSISSRPSFEIPNTTSMRLARKNKILNGVESIGWMG